MNVTMEVPDEFIDSIVEEALLSSYDSTKKELAALKKIKKPKEYQLEDIEDMTKYLEALEVVGSWFVWQFKKKAGIK
jgi:hypothetical protein